MPFIHRCPSCSTAGKVKEELVGRRIRCRKCGTTFLVAAPEPHNAVPSVTSLATRISTLDYGDLVALLIRVGEEGMDEERTTSGFLAEDDDWPDEEHPNRNPIARKIGQRLDELGGEPLMQKAHATIKEKLGKLPARELEACWGGIGEWQA